jgi:homoserine dehydrogenase
MSSKTVLRVAVLGAGTVGWPVVRAFLEHPERLAPFDGLALRLVGVADLFMERAIARGVPAAIVTDAPAHLVADPDVDVVVELMGGDEPARTLIAAALGAGKRVVTANKHVVAHHGAALEILAREHGGTLRFEAAVGGGIPILGPLAADLAANDVRQVRGIVNGTTNFILTSMRDHGTAYADALAAAQARGYAEANPRGDVEGDDAVNKVVILARLAFGSWLAPADVVKAPPTLRGDGRPGVTGVTAAEIAAAGALGLTLKLIALAEIGADGRPTASVLPSAVDQDGPLGRTSGVLNHIEVVADPVGTVAFTGPGAGGDPTSSAVLGDLVTLARGGGSTWAGLAPASVVPDGAASIDPLAAPRAWFALLPGVTPDQLHFGPTAAMAGAQGGTALRTGRLSLWDVRTTLRPVVAAGMDVTLYPVLE